MTIVQSHLPCPECGSSDALSINDDGSAYCFSCTGYTKQHNNPQGRPTMEVVNNNNNEPIYFADEGQYAALKDRDISLETAKKFGVKVTFDQHGEIGQSPAVAVFGYPVHQKCSPNTSMHAALPATHLAHFEHS